MTTQHATEPISEADVLAFLTKLNTWTRHLSSNERVCLEALLVHAAAAEDADIEGFMMNAEPYEPAVRPVPSPDSGPAGYAGGTGGFGLSAITPSLITTLLNSTTSPTVRGFGC